MLFYIFLLNIVFASGEEARARQSQRWHREVPETGFHLISVVAFLNIIVTFRNSSAFAILLTTLLLSAVAQILY